jgi:uncharacterized protein YukE
MHDDILKLALELSKTTGEKIAFIDRIMQRTQILSMNARLEAARAGDAGKSFAVVAQEMGHVAEEVKTVSSQLHAAIAENATLIEAAGTQMMLEFRGKRFADLSRNVVEIIDRNLYERSCDVRWWATDSAMVDAVQDPSPETARYATDRLATILRSYTVYLDLWIADKRGVIVANGRPDRYRGVVGQNVSNTEWFRKGMATATGDDFVVCDINRSNSLDNAQVATYATAIRAGGEERGETLGVLGIFFDWEPQATDIVKGVTLSEEEAKTTRVMLLNANHRVIASSTPFSDGEIYPLEPKEACGYYQRGRKLISYALTPGYETYKGLGWYGCIESKLAG